MTRAIFLTVILFSVVQTAMSQEAKLGLAERRAIKEYQDKKFPSVEKSIHDAAHYDVKLDVQWEKIARVGEADRYMLDEYWGQTIFQPLTAALKSVASDDMGRDALKKALKKIVVTYNPDTAPASNWPNGLTFEKGTLTINFAPYSNVGDETSSNFKERVKAIKDLLESKL
jgi:hypothetical protein